MRGATCSVVSVMILGATVPASAQGRSFDGQWRIHVVTEVGPCDPTYLYEIVVTNGMAAYAGHGNFTIRGNVDGSGRLMGSITRTRSSGRVTTATLNGRLTQNSGSGTWTGSGARECSGTWEADKGSNAR
jgi:hypothetical protein